MQKTIQKQGVDSEQHVRSGALGTGAHKKDGGSTRLESIARGAWARTAWRNVQTPITSSGWGSGRNNH